MAVKIKWLSDDADATRGSKAVQASLEDVADSMDDLVDAGAKIGKTTDDVARDLSKLNGRPFEEMRREVQRADDAVDDLSEEADDARRALDKVGDAGDDIGDKVDRGADKAKAGMEDFKSEAQQTARESAASFDGSAESIGDAFQEVAANAFSGFGPAGAVAGIAAAAGIGLAISGFQAVEERRKELEERANDLAQAYIDAGSMVLDSLTIAGRITDVLTTPETRKEAEELAKVLGDDMPLAVRALAGDTAALEEVNTRAAAAQEALNEQSTQQTENTGKRKTAIGEESAEMERLIQANTDLQGVQSGAALTAQIQSEALIGLINSAQGATVEVDEMGNRLYSLPDGKQILVDADTGQATTNVDNFKGDLDGVPENVTTHISVQADASQVYSLNQAITAARRNAERGIRVNTNTNGGGMQWE